MHASYPDLPHPSPVLPVAEKPVAAPSAALVVDVRDGSGRRLLACAEPVYATAAAEEVARSALATLRRDFLFAGTASLTDALHHAFAAANDDVCEHNAWPVAADHGRVLIGVTAIAIDRDGLLLGLAPPGQAVVVQNGALYAFPDLASWQPAYEASNGVSDAGPLGLTKSLVPVTFATLLAPGDAVLLGSAQLGRFLASTRYAELACHPDWLRAVVTRAQHEDQGLPAAVWLSIAPEPDLRPAPIRRQTTTRVSNGISPAAEVISPEMRRAIVVDRLRTRAIELMEHLAPASDPPPQLGAAWASSCRHKRPRRSGFAGERTSRMPLRGRAVAGLLALILLLSGLYAGYDHRQARASRAEDYLSTIDVSLAALASTQDSAAIDARLDTAEDALEAASRSGAPVSLLRSRQEAIAAARDQANGFTRLSGVTRLGTLPPEVDRDSIRLLGDDDGLFLVAGAVFRVESQSRSLTLLLAPGWTVDGRTVGPHLDAALNGDDLVVIDGASLFRPQSDGGWQATPLGTSEEFDTTGAVACAAFAGNLYVLDTATGGIAKYSVDRLASGPEQWLPGEKGQRPESALDIAVDRSIYVLRADGEIVEYYRGEVRESFRPAVEPSIVGSIALIGIPESDVLYVVATDGAEGRIVQFDRNGKNARQFLLPRIWHGDDAAATAFAQVRDVAVDETSGTVYFVGNDALWRASFPPEEPAA